MATAKGSVLSLESWGRGEVSWSYLPSVDSWDFASPSLLLKVIRWVRHQAGDGYGDLRVLNAQCLSFIQKYQLSAGHWARS